MPSEQDIPWLASASRSARWLVAVSGGADSVALLHLLHGAGFRHLVVCHLNHQLRGRASTADARFVANLAEKLGITYEIGRADVRARMHASSESLETAARNARHEFFATCAAKHRCRKILLAHHADDQAETVLWNLLRGSHGLKGMRPEQAITVAGKKLIMVRPMLSLRHADLVNWLISGGHKWREDASNQMPVAVRNRLRNEAFPLLTEIAGRDSIASFARAVEDQAERDQMEVYMVEQAKALDPQGRLHVPVLRSLPIAVQRLVLREYLKSHAVMSLDRALLDRAMDLLNPSSSPAVNLPGGLRLRRREARLWIGC